MAGLHVPAAWLVPTAVAALMIGSRLGARSAKGDGFKAIGDELRWAPGLRIGVCRFVMLVWAAARLLEQTPWSEYDAHGPPPSVATLPPTLLWALWALGCAAEVVLHTAVLVVVVAQGGGSAAANGSPSQRGWRWRPSLTWSWLTAGQVACTALQATGGRGTACWGGGNSGSGAGLLGAFVLHGVGLVLQQEHPAAFTRQLSLLALYLPLEWLLSSTAAPAASGTGSSPHDLATSALLYYVAAHCLMAGQASFVAWCRPEHAWWELVAGTSAAALATSGASQLQHHHRFGRTCRSPRRRTSAHADFSSVDAAGTGWPATGTAAGAAAAAEPPGSGRPPRTSTLWHVSDSTRTQAPPLPQQYQQHRHTQARRHTSTGPNLDMSVSDLVSGWDSTPQNLQSPSHGSSSALFANQPDALLPGGRRDVHVAPASAAAAATPLPRGDGRALPPIRIGEPRSTPRKHAPSASPLHHRHLQHQQHLQQCDAGVISPVVAMPLSPNSPAGRTAPSPALAPAFAAAANDAARGRKPLRGAAVAAALGATDVGGSGGGGSGSGATAPTGRPTRHSHNRRHHGHDHQLPMGQDDVLQPYDGVARLDGEQDVASCLELWLLRRGLACALACGVLFVYLSVLLPLAGAGSSADEAGSGGSVCHVAWNALRALPSLLCLAALLVVNAAAGVSALAMGGQPLPLGPLSQLLHFLGGAAGSVSGCSTGPQEAMKDAISADLTTSNVFAAASGGSATATVTAGSGSEVVTLGSILRCELLLRAALPVAAALAVVPGALHGPASPVGPDHLYALVALQAATGEVAAMWATGYGGGKDEVEASAGTAAVVATMRMVTLPAAAAFQIVLALAARTVHLLAALAAAAAAVEAGGGGAEAAESAPRGLALWRQLLDPDPRQLPEYFLGAALVLVLRAVLLRGSAAAVAAAAHPAAGSLSEAEAESAGAGARGTLDAGLAAPATAAQILAAGQVLIQTEDGVAASDVDAGARPMSRQPSSATTASSAAHASLTPAGWPNPPAAAPLHLSSSNPQLRSEPGEASDPAHADSASGPQPFLRSSQAAVLMAGSGLISAHTTDTGSGVAPRSPTSAAAQARFNRRAPPARSISFNLRQSITFGSQALASALSPLAVGAMAALRDAAAPPTPVSCRQSATSVVSEQIEALLDLKRLSAVGSGALGVAGIAAAGPSGAGVSGGGLAVAAAAAVGGVFARAHSIRRRRGSNVSVDNGGIALYNQHLSALMSLGSGGGGGGGGFSGAGPPHSLGSPSRLAGLHADLRGWASEAPSDEDDSEDGAGGGRSPFFGLTTTLDAGSHAVNGGGGDGSSAPTSPLRRTALGAGTAVGSPPDAPAGSRSGGGTLSRRSLRRLASMPSRLRSSAAVAAVIGAEVEGELEAAQGVATLVGDGGLSGGPHSSLGGGGGDGGGGAPVGERSRWRQKGSPRAAAATMAMAAARGRHSTMDQAYQRHLLATAPDMVGSWSAAAAAGGPDAASAQQQPRRASGDGGGGGGGAAAGAVAGLGLAVGMSLAAGGTAGAGGAAEQDLRKEALRQMVMAKWRSSMAAEAAAAEAAAAASSSGATVDLSGSDAAARMVPPQITVLPGDGGGWLAASDYDEDVEELLSDSYGTAVHISAATGSSSAEAAAAALMLSSATGAWPMMHMPRSSAAAAALALAEVAAVAEVVDMASPRSAASTLVLAGSGLLSSLPGTGTVTGNASAITGNSRRSLGVSSRNTSIKTSILSRNSSLNRGYGSSSCGNIGGGGRGALSAGVSTRSLLGGGSYGGGSGGGDVAAKALDMVASLRRWWWLRGAPLVESAWLGEAGALLLQLVLSPALGAAVGSHAPSIMQLLLGHGSSGDGVSGVAAAACGWLALAPQAACVAHLAALAAAPEWCKRWGPMVWAARAAAGPALQRAALAGLGLTPAAGPLRAAWDVAYMTAALRLTAPQHGALVLAATAALVAVTLGTSGAAAEVWSVEAALRLAAGLLSAGTVGAAAGLLAARVLPAAAAGLLTSSALRRRLSPVRAAAAALLAATALGDSEATTTGAAVAYLLVARAALLRMVRALRAVGEAALRGVGAIAKLVISASASFSSADSSAAAATAAASSGTLAAHASSYSSNQMRAGLRRWLMTASPAAPAGIHGVAGAGEALLRLPHRAAAALSVALPKQTPAAAAVGALVALLLALAAGQALLLAALTGDGRRVARFHRRQAGLMSLKARLLAAPTVLELLHELTSGAEELLDGCSAWAVIVPTSSPEDTGPTTTESGAYGGGGGGKGGGAVTGVLLEVRLHADLLPWPAGLQWQQRDTTASAAAEAPPSALTSPRPPGMVSGKLGAARAARKFKVAADGAGAGTCNGAEGVEAAEEEELDGDQDEDREGLLTAAGDADGVESTNDVSPSCNKPNNTGGVQNGGGGGGGGNGRAPSVQLAEYPSLQLAMAHRTIWCVQGRTARVYGGAAHLSDTLILQQPTPPDLEQLAAAVGAGALLVLPMECLAQPYGLLVVACAHPAAADRYLRLLALGLADGLAQALYLKQLQADVAASEMVMQDIYPSHAVQVVKRRFHVQGAASARTVPPLSVAPVTTTTATSAAGSISGAPGGGAGGAGGIGSGALGLNAGGGATAATSLAASPSAFLAASTFRSPPTSSHPFYQHASTNNPFQPPQSAVSLPQFGSTSSNPGGGGGYGGGAGGGSQGPGRVSNSGAASGAGAGSLGSGAGGRGSNSGAVAGVGAGSAGGGRGLYAAMTSALSGPASTLGGMMSFGRSDSAPLSAAAAAMGNGAGGNRMSLDVSSGSPMPGTPRSQTLTPSQAAAVAAFNSSTGGGGGPSSSSGALPATAAAALASALVPALRPVAVASADGGGRGSPMASVTGFLPGGGSVGGAGGAWGDTPTAAFAAALESGSAFGSQAGGTSYDGNGPDVPYARWHSAVTVLFADICGYTAMSQALEAEQVMALLHSLFCKYDRLLPQFGVYKVETIGDCFMAATGLVAEAPEHALDMVRFGRAMIAAAAEVVNPVNGEPLQIRVGVNSGRVMSGIVGACRARYCLFGDTVNTASRLESTGVPGMLQISEETFAQLHEEERAAWECRGFVEMKGKGMKRTYISGVDGPLKGVDATIP